MAPALLNFMCKYIIKEEWKIHSEYLCFCDVLILSWHPDNWHQIDIVTVDVPHKRIGFATSKPLCNMAVRWWMLTLAEVRKSTSIHDWKSLDKSKYNWRAIEQCFLSLQFKITPDLNARLILGAQVGESDFIIRKDSRRSLWWRGCQFWSSPLSDNTRDAWTEFN